MDALFGLERNLEAVASALTEAEQRAEAWQTAAQRMADGAGPCTAHGTLNPDCTVCCPPFSMVLALHTEAAEQRAERAEGEAKSQEARGDAYIGEIKRLEARVRELEAALLPFALAYDQRDDDSYVAGPPTAIQIAGVTHGENPWQVARALLPPEREDEG